MHDRRCERTDCCASTMIVINYFSGMEKRLQDKGIVSRKGQKGSHKNRCHINQI